MLLHLEVAFFVLYQRLVNELNFDFKIITQKIKIIRLKYFENECKNDICHLSLGFDNVFKLKI